MRNLLSMLRMGRSPSVNPSPSEQLRQRLESAKVSFLLNEATSFVPINELKELVKFETVQRILQELESNSSASLEKLSATLVQAAPKLFALLVWIGQVRLIFDLGPEFLNDTSLPLDIDGLALAKLRATLDWSTECEARILRDQWIFLAPVFQNGPLPIEIYSSAPLPFISVAPISKESDNRTIRQVQIHPAHFGSISEDGDNDVAARILALKLFKRKGSKRFEHEVHVLQLLNQIHNCNIVKLLVAFSSDTIRGMIFPWAECDLSEMMTQALLPNQRDEIGTWTVQQFIGLLEGLAAIHQIPGRNGSRSNTQCRHGDLRPANILIMKDSSLPACHTLSIARCNLQISSMAMTELFQDAGQYTIPLETGTYQGPECHLEIAIGPLYDIWSLGALFLEIMIWYLEGPSALKAFANERTASDPLFGESVNDDYFFTLSVEDEQYVGAEIRNCVMLYIERLEKDERLSSVFVAILNVVKHNMLVPIGSQRLGAIELSKKLRNILNGREKGDGV